MRKSKLIYIIYVMILITLTTYFSVKIIQKDTGITGFAIKELFHINKGEYELPKYDHQFIRKRNDSKFQQELIPNSECLYDGFLIRLPLTYIKINSDGFRDREFIVKKPNNTFRIIALGDSFTFGWCLNLSDTWPKQLERKLNIINSSLHFEVLNFGVPGYSTFQEVEMYKEKGIKYNPDLIILGFHGNDVQNTSRVNELMEGTKLELEKSDLELSQKEVDIYASTTAIKLYTEELKKKPFEEVWNIVNVPLLELINLSIRKNIDLIIVSFSSNSSDHMNVLNKLAKEHNFYLIGLQERVYLKYPKSKMVLHQIDPHPSKFACDVISDEILENILYHKLINIKTSR